MPKLIHNKQELDQFNIGFEFEFFVADKSITKPQKAQEKIPANILKEYGHLFNVKTPTIETHITHEEAGKYFLRKMKEYYPSENWDKMFEIHYDGSLDSTSTHTGVEMVLKYTQGSEAIKNLVKVFSVLNLPEFKTTSACGLHVNTSFIDIKKNRRDLAYDVTMLLDNDVILRNFSRTKNEYCVSNSKTKIDTYWVKETLTDKVNDFIVESKMKSSEYDMKKFNQITKNLTSAATMKEFCALIEDTVKNTFLEEWESNRPAIAPKNKSGKNYLEFRSMGGKDYQKKHIHVEAGINELLKSIKKADLMYSKKNVTKVKTKMMA